MNNEIKNPRGSSNESKPQKIDDPGKVKEVPVEKPSDLPKKGPVNPPSQYPGEVPKEVPAREPHVNPLGDPGPEIDKTRMS